MLTTIISGEVDAADFLFLVAVIVFGALTVMAAVAGDRRATLTSLGWFCLALGWLVL
jgi:hypothetical protein